jgi:hypothetical protein
MIQHSTRDLIFETCVALGGPASAATPPAACVTQRVGWMSGCSPSAAPPRMRRPSG